MLSETALAEKMAVCRKQRHWGHLSTPPLREVYLMHRHASYGPLRTDNSCRSCVDGERGPLEKMPKRQTFRSSKRDLISSLPCLGTQHPSLPAPLYPYLTDTHPGNSSPEVLQGAELPGFQGVASLLFPILFQAQLQPLSLVLRL